MIINDIPVVAFFKYLLDPFMIWGSLVLLTLLYDETFTGYYLVLMIIAFFISTYIFEQTNLYRKWHNGKLLAYVRDTFVGWGAVVGVLLFLGYATKLSYRYSDEVILTWMIVTPFALITSHFVVHKIITDLRKKGIVRSAVIIGANNVGTQLQERIAEFPYLLIDLRGYFDDRDASRIKGVTLPVLGPVSEVGDYVRKNNIQMIFVSLPMATQPRICKLLDDLHDTTASIYFLPDVYIFDMMQARFDNVGGVPVVAICESPLSGVDTVVKNFSDIVLASLILILISPILLAIVLAIKLTSPGPAIFRQRRYGLNGESFIVYKFRSMTVCEDGSNIVQAQKNDQRTTKIGAFLRRTSLDELPQFINVLQGRMSIVGPRPHAVAHNEMYRKLIKGYMLRHKVKPGITGWAQVNGCRGETQELDKMKERIEFDLDYLQNWSIWLDLWIIMRTVWVVLRRDNAY
ncbi:UDP-glucose:undecaprenyl-phosphate glucose-1-phosphate transferase [mine drainage metagenome]|uniref:UDP-glucose:undecaprenyl-phosphate glucose-1-phosphate transferase n=1 Tax=mine drainage metagenome TaxID=410659 RepID=A0A1J5SG74_9ZZZZ